jgi:hypothetical protein
MDALDTRNAIVNVFYENLNNFKQSKDVGNLSRVYEYDNLKIEHDLFNNTITFKMYVYAEYDQRQYSGRIETKRLDSVVNVLEWRQDSVSMISASDDMSWVNFTKTMVSNSNTTALSYFENDMVEIVTTSLNLHYPVLPKTEEEHFQTATTQDYILDFEQCQRLQMIVDYFESFGLFIKGSGNRVYIKFK